MLYGKTLPAPLVQAFISALTKIAGGSGGTPSILNVLDSYLTQELKLHHIGVPLWSFYRLTWGGFIHPDDTAYYHDKDYFWMSMLMRAIIEIYGERGGKGVSQRIGALMWAGKIHYREHPYIEIFEARKRKLIPNPVFTGIMTESSVRILVIEHIIRVLKQHFNLNHFQSIEGLPVTKYRIALEAFVEAIQSQTNVPCKLDGNIISFPECPFCLNQEPECKVWIGVIQAFMRWLDDQEWDYMTMNVYKLPTLVDLPASKPHEIVIKLNN